MVMSWFLILAAMVLIALMLGIVAVVATLLRGRRGNSNPDE